MLSNSSKKIYSTYNELSSRGISDDVIINKLLETLQQKSTGNDLTFITFLSDYYVKGCPQYIDIIELIGLTHQKRKEKEVVSSTDARKHHGIYYTNYSIAHRLAKEVVSLYSNDFNPSNKTFLEPCSGIGIFAIAYLDVIFGNSKKAVKDAQLIINKMFFADIDLEALKLLEILIPLYLKLKYQVDVTIPKQNIYNGDALFNGNVGSLSKNNLRSVFNTDSGFDIVLTNPPYKLLKANQDKYDKNSNYKDEVSSILKYIRSNDVYKYNSGTLNLYKLFVEDIIENFTNNEGRVGLLIPSTFLRDKQSYELRKQILDNYLISKIYTIPERNFFFLDISQAFCFFCVDKSKNANSFDLVANVFDTTEFDNKSIRISKSKIPSVSTLNEVISTDTTGWNILTKIHKNRKISEIPSIINLRGELDLTLNKKSITEDKTEFRLLRGNGVGEFTHTLDKNFVDQNFVKGLNGKGRYLCSDRLVCQQISNVTVKKRLKFTKIPRNVVLGNSCNFIALNSDSLFSESIISLDYILGVMNSFLMNWRFQLTSSNNHIGNYEINELPLAIPTKEQSIAVDTLVKQILKEPNDIELKAKLNFLIFVLYGLSKEEALYILNDLYGTKLADRTAEIVKHDL